MNRGRRTKDNHPLVKIVGKRIADKMKRYQVEQGNSPNLNVFLRSPSSSKYAKGFDWQDTEEGFDYWHDISLKIRFSNGTPW